MVSSDKHGAMHDDQLKHETEGLVRSGHSTRAEEWRDPEPSGEDQPDSDRAPDGTLIGGTPDGLTEQDVEGRSELAQQLRGVTWPADREALRAAASGPGVRDRVRGLVEQLPTGRDFANVAEVWTALGGGQEEHRF
jgi:hypothetical protein